MKKSEKELSSVSAGTDGKGEGITRRDFLKGTAGFVLLCGSGFGLRGLLGSLSASDPIGPQLREELTVRSEIGGARVLAGGQTCFTVNQEGAQLLSLADGRHTLEEIIRSAGMAESAESVADFFLTLGRAGYLTTKVEVNKVAVCL